MFVPMAIPNSLDHNRRIYVFKASLQRLKPSYSERYNFCYLLVKNIIQWQAILLNLLLILILIV